MIYVGITTSPTSKSANDKESINSVGCNVKSSSRKDEIYNQRVSANGCDSDEDNQDPIPVGVLVSNAIY